MLRGITTAWDRATPGWIWVGSFFTAAGALLGAQCVGRDRGTAPPDRSYTYLATRRPPGRPDDPAVRADRPWMAHEPTDQTVEQWAPVRPVPVEQEWTALQQALEACGIPVQIRQLPASEDTIYEAWFDPDARGGAGVIQMNPAALSRDPYTLQTLTHEAFHALLHNRRCLPHPDPDHRRQEDQAEAGTVWLFDRLGLPLETYDGDVFAPGTYRFDEAAARREFTADEWRNLEWAEQWLYDAATGRHPPCVTCPVPQGGSAGAAAPIAQTVPLEDAPAAFDRTTPQPVDADCTPDQPTGCTLNVLLTRMEQLGEEAGVTTTPITAIFAAGTATEADAMAAARSVADAIPAGPIRDEAELWYAAAAAELAEAPDGQGGD